MQSLFFMVDSFRCGYEGIEGSHSENALLQLFETQSAFRGKLAASIGCTSFEQVCERISDGSIDLGILPIENSVAGTFFGVLELLEK
jgi:prephenate dehydratase